MLQRNWLCPYGIHRAKPIITKVPNLDDAYWKAAREHVSTFYIFIFIIIFETFLQSGANCHQTPPLREILCFDQENK
jgi:hypothetical protein